MESNSFNSLAKAKQIKKMLNDNDDVIIKEINAGKINYAIIFIDVITNQEEINLNIINSLYKFSQNKSEEQITINSLLSSEISFCNAEIIKPEDIVLKVLKGFAVLLVDNIDKAIAFNVIKYESRSIEEPPNSTVISGPREGFTENIKTNMSLLRKRVSSTKLKMESLEIGKRTKTAVKVVYFTDLVDKDVLAKLMNKLNEIEIDGVLDSYYISSFIERKPNSIFRQVGICEKPDIAVAKLLEGRIAIFVDGSPIVLTVPFVALEDFQSSNDYYSESHHGTFLRGLRVLAFIMSVYLPGMYMALQLYHYKVLPLKFLVTIVNTTQNLPLNPFLEIFFIIILFDILFEASVRMPKYLGIAVSIVGALILGDTAVKAGLVSPPGVMIVAMSAINIYINPNQSSQISMLRFAMAFIGGVLGFHGIVLATVFIISYLADLDSFGSPYLAPYAPYILSDQKDGIIKDELIKMSSMPKSFPNSQRNRMSFYKRKQK